MDDLGKMIKFLQDTKDELQGIEKKLDSIQEYFNNNFSNVNLVKKNEIEFLQNAFFINIDSFPEEIRKTFKLQLKEQEEEFIKNQQALEKQRNVLQDKFLASNNKRLGIIKRIRSSNKVLDDKEERLKANVAELENEIDIYNKKIDELKTGFGLITNLFNMRNIQKNKDLLIEKRDSLVLEIEEIRTKWQEKDKAFSEDTEKIKTEWNDVHVDLSLTEEKLENLKKNSNDIIRKAAFNKTLDEIIGEEKYLLKNLDSEKPLKCPRCNSDNQNNLFFCYYCGERFSSDRKDILGSLVEVGELNQVYTKLLDGIKEAVSFLALLKGILTGIDKFLESVSSVKKSQDQYSALPELKISIPGPSMALTKNITDLNNKIDIKFFNLHPSEFASSFKEYTDKIFTEKNIEGFFNTMGDELNKTTKEQW